MTTSSAETRYFVAKCGSVDSLRTCVAIQKWACRPRLYPPQPQDELAAAFSQGPVTLIFSVNNCHGWHGYCRMVSAPRPKENSAVPCCSEEASVPACNDNTAVDDTDIDNCGVSAYSDVTVTHDIAGAVQSSPDTNHATGVCLQSDGSSTETDSWHYFDVLWKTEFISSFGETCLPSSKTSALLLSDGSPLNKARNWQEMHANGGAEVCSLLDSMHADLVEKRRQREEAKLAAKPPPFISMEGDGQTESGLYWKLIVEKVERELGPVHLACPFGSQRNEPLVYCICCIFSCTLEEKMQNGSFCEDLFNQQHVRSKVQESGIQNSAHIFMPPNLDWNIILRKAEKCEEWRKLVVKSTVVPQRSARLRDRYNVQQPDSDIDAFIVYEADTRDLLGFSPPKMTVKNNDRETCDYTVLEMKRYCELLLAYDGRCIETLFLDDSTIVQASENWRQLQSLRQQFLTRKCLDKYLGDALGSNGVQKLQRLLETGSVLEEDVVSARVAKLVYIIVRLLQNAVHIVRGGPLLVFRPKGSEEWNLLQKIRAANITVAEARTVIGRLQAEIEDGKSQVTEEVTTTKTAVQSWLLSLRFHNFQKSPPS